MRKLYRYKYKYIQICKRKEKVAVNIYNITYDMRSRPCSILPSKVQLYRNNKIFKPAYIIVFFFPSTNTMKFRSKINLTINITTAWLGFRVYFCMNFCIYTYKFLSTIQSIFLNLIINKLLIAILSRHRCYYIRFHCPIY